LAALLVQNDRTLKLAAIEGIKRLERPDLLASLRERSHLELDLEIAKALGYGEEKP